MRVMAVAALRHFPGEWRDSHSFRPPRLPIFPSALSLIILPTRQVFTEMRSEDPDDNQSRGVGLHRPTKELHNG